MSRACHKPPADDVIAAIAAEHDLLFLALKPRSYLVAYVQDITANIAGLSMKAPLPSLVGSADTLIGPVQRLDAVTEVDSAGAAINVAKNVSASIGLNIAPTGSVKPTDAARSVHGC